MPRIKSTVRSSANAGASSPANSPAASPAKLSVTQILQRARATTSNGGPATAAGMMTLHGAAAPASASPTPAGPTPVSPSPPAGRATILSRKLARRAARLQAGARMDVDPSALAAELGTAAPIGP
ncbi:MAG: hypothetical protein ACKOEM_07545, partial [Planctomycetia bacterium]